MSYELLYTSAPRGLRPLSSGFCTVAHTAGLPTQWISRLESISTYGADPPGGPPEFAHRRLVLAGSTYSVLSRVVPSGVDESRRPNHLAHHLVLSPSERPSTGPASMMRQAGRFADAFVGPPRLLDKAPAWTAVEEPTANATATWDAICGGVGWAERWIAPWVQEPSRPIYLIYPDGAPILELLDEAIRLLPPVDRWRPTFATRHNVGAGGDFAWRCAATGSREASRWQASSVERLIDLSKLASR